jgi:EmrB/QacA subfamily drug resistance transporter
MPDTLPDQTSFPTERSPHLRIVIPAIVAIAFLMEQLDATVIVTAIPRMAESLATTPLRMNLAVTAYVLALAMFIPLSGWLADRFGSRRIFALSLLVFTAGSVLCGLATSFEMLIATRVLQGLGGAMMIPVGRLILIRSFPRRKLATAMAYMTYPAIAGPLLGPVVGGFLTTYFSWRWIFYINVPFGLAGMFAALRYVEDVEADPTARFDFPGFLLAGSGFAFLQFGMENVGRGALPPVTVVAILAAAAFLLVAFARYARRIAAPAVDLTLFRLRSFRIATLAGGLCRVGFNGVPFLLPLLLQLGFGVTPLVSGALTCASALAAVPVRAVAVALLRRLGFRDTMIASAVAGSLAIAAFAALTTETPKWLIVALVLVFGLTRSAQFMSSNMLAYADIPSGRLSRATSLGGALQQLSVSFGVSAAAILLALVAPSGVTLTAEDFRTVFLLSALIPLLAIPGFLLLRPDDGAEVIEGRAVR